MTYERLKLRHRNVRDGYPANLNLRIPRALSWLKRAEMADDLDGRYIFLWIAFNAAYATEIAEDNRLSEQEAFKTFLERLCALDQARKVDNLVWTEYAGSIRILLDTPYVFQSFWDFHSGKISEADWQARFARGKAAAQRALAGGNTPMLLGVIFQRLYTLRNQLIHGGATWDSAVNRKQLRDCVGLLGKLVPLVIELMLANPTVEWGPVCYPVVGDN